MNEDYKVIKKIGQGGVGEVFMVLHLPTDQIRAMKVLSKSSDKIVKSVFNEIIILRELDHPNILKIFEYYQDEQKVYIFSEYLKGGSLQERLRDNGRLEEREAAFVMNQIFQAMAYCHSKGIMHRDMKLENVMFVRDESMQIKVLDFGSAIKLDESHKNVDRVVTAYYVAPEVAM